MTYQHRSSLTTRRRSPSPVAAIAAITLAGIALACSDNTYLGNTQSLAGAPSTGGSITSGPGVGGATAASNGSGVVGSGATGAIGSGATGAIGSGATGAMIGTGATGAMGSGATGAMIGTGATGAMGSGATGNVGGSTGTGFVCSSDIRCLRAIECVERCGGPVLQSSCCPCPSGTFDSFECGVGGAPGTGGGGSTSQGGATSSGATSSGATSSGGTTTTMPGGIECIADTDCRIEGDCCGCYSFGPGQRSSCEMDCPSLTTCNNFDPQPLPRCIAGRCTLDRSCDDRKVVCKRVTPQCDAGKLPSLMEGDLCWDGNCIDVVDCSAVTGCDVCKSNGLMCVYDSDTDVAHCVALPVEVACALPSRCACHRNLCGAKACTETPTGISCSG
jgi:hypothetical protein